MEILLTLITILSSFFSAFYTSDNLNSKFRNWFNELDTTFIKFLRENEKKKVFEVFDSLRFYFIVIATINFTLSGIIYSITKNIQSISIHSFLIIGFISIFVLFATWYVKYFKENLQGLLINIGIDAGWTYIFARFFESIDIPDYWAGIYFVTIFIIRVSSFVISTIVLFPLGLFTLVIASFPIYMSKSLLKISDKPNITYILHILTLLSSIALVIYQYLKNS